MRRWDGSKVAGPVSRATSVLADRAQSECARSMRAVRGRPASPSRWWCVIVKTEAIEKRGRPNDRVCSRNAHDRNVLVGRAQ